MASSVRLPAAAPSSPISAISTFLPPLSRPRPWTNSTLVLLGQPLEALVQPLHDLVAALRHGGEVDARLADGDAEILRLLNLRVEVGRLEHGLGGDAADVEARAADLVRVHQGDLEAQLPGPEGRRVAAGAGAQDDEVEAVGGSDGHGSAGSDRGAGGTTAGRPSGAAGHPAMVRRAPRCRNRGRAWAEVAPTWSADVAEATLFLEHRMARFGRFDLRNPAILCSPSVETPGGPLGWLPAGPGPRDVPFVAWWTTPRPRRGDRGEPDIQGRARRGPALLQAATRRQAWAGTVASQSALKFSFEWRTSRTIEPESSFSATPANMPPCSST